MTFELPELPYPKNALEPHISAETLEYHHGKHHAAYVANLNKMVPGSKFENKALEDIVRSAPAGGLFNNAAQVWNHTFYFKGMSPEGGGEPAGEVAKALASTFGSFADFKDQFSKAAAGNFGSGWTWLARSEGGELEIVSTDDAGTVLTMNKTPLLTIDVWEHAYYIDTRNARPKYIENWWNLVNWDAVAKLMKG